MPPAASESQTAIDVLKADNDKLNAKVASLTSDRDKWKGDAEGHSKRIAELEKSAGDPEGHKKKVEELSAQLRTITHKTAFAKAAKAADAHEDDIDDLFTLSGYKAEKDDIDEKVIGDLVADLKTKKPRFFQQQSSGQQSTTSQSTQSITPGQQRSIPGAGRGGAAGAAGTGTMLTRANMADPKFMLNPNNKALIADAAANGRFER